MNADFRVTEIFTEPETNDVIALCYDVLYEETFEKFLGNPEEFDGKENASNLLKDTNYAIPVEIRADIEDIFGVREFDAENGYDDGYQFYDFGDDDLDFVDNRKKAVVSGDASMDPGFDEYDVRETFNLREALNKIDWNTDNKYDLLNLYEACNLSENEKRALANIVYDQEDAEVIYDTLNDRYVKGEEIGMPERVKDGVIHEDYDALDVYSTYEIKDIKTGKVIKKIHTTDEDPDDSTTWVDDESIIDEYGEGGIEITRYDYDNNMLDNSEVIYPGELDESKSIKESVSENDNVLSKAVELLYIMDKFVVDVYDNEGWLMNGIPDGEFNEGSAESARQNWEDHSWLVIDEYGNPNLDDFRAFVDVFRRSTRSNDYNQEERDSIIAKAEELLQSNLNKSKSIKEDVGAKTFSQWYDESHKGQYDKDREAKYYPFSNYIKTFPNAEVLKDATAEDIKNNAHRFYDEYDVDSADREHAFNFASEELGLAYDVFYDAWLNEEPIESANESLTEYLDNIVRREKDSRGWCNFVKEGKFTVWQHHDWVLCQVDGMNEVPKGRKDVLCLQGELRINEVEIFILMKGNSGRATDEDIEAFGTTREEITKIMKDYANKYMSNSKNESLKESIDKNSLKSKLEAEIRDVVKNFGYDDDFVNDYIFVEVKEDKFYDGEPALKCEIRTELSYEECFELASKLTPIVEAEDNNAYFDMEDAHTLVAYLDPNTTAESELTEAWEPEFSDEWNPEDIELWKSIDWKTRNYMPYVDESNTIRGEVVAYGLPGGERKAEVMFAKELSPNPIYAPKWVPTSNPFEGTVGFMYDGVNHTDGYMMMTRTETQDVYDTLSH